MIVQVSDGSLSATQALAVSVTNVNECRAITSAAVPSVAENTTGVIFVTSTDPDAGTATFTIVGGADAALFSMTSVGVLTFKSLSYFESPTDVGANNVYDVIVQVSDGSLVASQAVAVTVTNVNEAPAITSNGGGATVGLNVQESSTAVAIVTSADPDVGSTATYSIVGGADASLFSMTSVGVLTFKSLRNFESPTDVDANNVYDVIVQVSDNGSPKLSDMQAIAVTLTDVGVVVRSVGVGPNQEIRVVDDLPAGSANSLKLVRSGSNYVITSRNGQKLGIEGTFASLNGANLAATIPDSYVEAGTLSFHLGGGADVVELDTANDVVPGSASGLVIYLGGNDGDTLNLQSSGVNAVPDRLWTNVGSSTTIALVDFGTITATGVKTAKGDRGNDTFRLGTGTTVTSVEGDGGTRNSLQVTRHNDVVLGNSSLVVHAVGTTIVKETIALTGINLAEISGGGVGNLITLNAWTGETKIAAGGGDDTLSILGDLASYELGAGGAFKVGAAGTGTSSGIERFNFLLGAGNNNVKLLTGFRTGLATDGLVLAPGAGDDSLEVTADTNFKVTEVGGGTPGVSIALAGAINYNLGATDFERLVLTGGVGNNAFVFNDFSGRGTVSGGPSGTDSLRFTRNADFSLFANSLLVGGKTIGFSNIDSLSLTGGADNNYINAFGYTGLAGLLTVDGGAGNDVIIGRPATTPSSAASATTGFPGLLATTPSRATMAKTFSAVGSGQTSSSAERAKIS